MKRFANLFLSLDRTNKTNEKVELLKGYFLSAPDEDKIWALALFTGRRPPRKIRTTDVHVWAMEMAGIPDWLFRESYHSVGDLAETISLILPESEGSSDKTLSEWFHYLSALNTATDEEKKKYITDAWRQLSRYEIFVFNKLLMGSFRVGVSQTLVVRAIGEATGMEPPVVSHRVMGKWNPSDTTWQDLIHSENIQDHNSKPYPFYLAYSLELSLEDMGRPDEWFVEWKWDGIRSQIILRDGEIFIWSRGEDLITDKFPELHSLKNAYKGNIVLDGELICFMNDRPMPFNVLQTRIGRKNLTKKILESAPIAFIAYDILEFDGVDIRNRPQEERRKILEKVQADAMIDEFRISPLISMNEWDDLRNLHSESRSMAAEGFMLKRKNSVYMTGRKKGDWWKWKVDPLSIDAVLVYAQKGHGRRAELFTDYTFAVWNESTLIPFAKAYSGLTDAEIVQVDRFIKQNTIEKFGPVRTVKANLVFEIGFEGILKSTRHKSGIAVRFPRILRWRKDKQPEEADTLDNLRKILNQYHHEDVSR